MQTTTRWDQTRKWGDLHPSTTYFSDLVSPCGIQHPSLDLGPSSTVQPASHHPENKSWVSTFNRNLFRLGCAVCVLQLQVSMKNLRNSHGKHHLWLNISKIASNHTFQTSNISRICWKLMMLLFHRTSWHIRYHPDLIKCCKGNRLLFDYLFSFIARFLLVS